MIEKNVLTKDMKKVVIKMKVLKIIEIKKTYSYAIIKKIAESKHMAQFFGDINTIRTEVYNTINILEKSGYIRLAKQSKTGRITNYYMITEKGRYVLNNARKVFVLSIKEIASLFE